jgi:AmpD protein
MNVCYKTGLLKNCPEFSFHLSPNHDDRPRDTIVDLLVIHAISLPPDEFGGSEVHDLFMNRLNPDEHPYFKSISNLKVSAHLYIRRSGEIIQYVPLHLRAWHAGESCFNGRKQCNDFSIGIELEGTDKTTFMPAQYQQLSRVTRAIMQAYPEITPDSITGHSDIAPGRKQDPGPFFDWDAYKHGIISCFS